MSLRLGSGIGGWFAACLLVQVVVAAEGARPDIVVIVADDLGFSDPSCFGGEIRTPALDRLADEGIRFTRFYNGGMCVVSRLSLMTGKWWPRAQRSFGGQALLSERLQSAGYRTALIGKWHLPGDPMDRGFDHFFGFLGGFSNHFTGGPGYRIDRKPFSDFGDGYYSSDAFAERAVRFIEAGGKKEAPLFLYLSFQAPLRGRRLPQPTQPLRHRPGPADGARQLRLADEVPDLADRVGAAHGVHGARGLDAER